MIGGRKKFDVGCTVEVENSFETLHAHVNLDGDIEIQPGDEVIVHGAPIHAAFGERIVERRIATVIRAGWFNRITTKVSAGFELTELYEVSFSPRRTL